MSLYPSLEDMNVDIMARAQLAQYQPATAPLPYSQPTAPSVHAFEASTAPSPMYSLPPAAPSAPSAHVYPSLGNYMGLELSADVIARNMPEYQVQTVQNGPVTLVAPISSQSLTVQKATVTQAIRQVVLCKDKEGKCGIRLHSINCGLFVCYVAANSPAALAGLRFGDQILEINNQACAGMTMEQGHDLLKRLPVNGITMAVRDRPFERTVTLHKDSLGHVGFQFKDGKIMRLVKDSSAARNGVLTDHQLLEVNTINVVGMTDADICNVIAKGPEIVNITIIPSYIYEHMIKKMSKSLFKGLDRTPAV